MIECWLCTELDKKGSHDLRRKSFYRANPNKDISFLWPKKDLEYPSIIDNHLATASEGRGG